MQCVPTRICKDVLAKCAADIFMGISAVGMNLVQPWCPCILLCKEGVNLAGMIATKITCLNHFD